MTDGVPTSNQMFLTARGMEATGVLAATTTSKSGAWKPRPRLSTIWFWRVVEGLVFGHGVTAEVWGLMKGFVFGGGGGGGGGGGVGVS